MFSQDSAIHPAGLESITSVQESAVAALRALYGMRAVPTAAIAIGFALALSAAAQAATITVNSLADPGAAGICVLRDAITAANSHTRVNGCKAGTGKDMINFSVNGSIVPTNFLQGITDAQLTIEGPITITGGGFNGFAGDLLTVAAGANVTFQKLTFTNFEQDNTNAFGNNGTLTIANCTFSGDGLASNLTGGVLTITNSIFSGNGSKSADAGAINNLGSLTIIKSTFDGNVGGKAGAIDNFGTATIRKSTFSNNGSDSQVEIGAIRNEGTLTITNSTFSGNTGIDSGAIANSNDAELTVISSTFSDNMGQMTGDIFGGLVTARNSIFADSTSFGSPIRNCGANITDGGYNISDDTTCGFAKTGSANNGDGVNPLLSTAGLANNGGPTQTIALNSESPAIDVIPLADCTDQNGKRLKTDQRGFPRPDAEENVCDIGAFETQDGCSQNQQGNNNCQ